VNKIIDLFLKDLPPELFKKALANMAAQGKLDRLEREEPDTVQALKAAFGFAASKEGAKFWVHAIMDLGY
jgi:hypothetical protein